jgi:hypothetical protein
MWVFTYVGALFNGLTLLILGKSTKPLEWKITEQRLCLDSSSTNKLRDILVEILLSCTNNRGNKFEVVSS